MRALVLLAAFALAAGCTLPGSQPPPRPYYEEVLSAAPFTQLVVEVDHAPGRIPSKAAQDHLLAELRNVTQKESISIRLEETLPGDARTWTAAELVALERETRTAAHAAPVAVMHVLYPAGSFTNADAAGVTISGPVIGPVVIFLDKMDEFRSPVGGLPNLPVPYPAQAREQVERVTLLHEAGHAMGLVNNGLPMVTDHEDDAHAGHSSNEASVMYWAVDQLSGIRDALTSEGTLPAYFDADDRADLRAAGGR